MADRAIESGHDLKLVCRELSGLVRDLMIISVDPGRAGDGELAEGERERLAALAERFSREDLMRAFDLLAKAETDIRTASHPRYHFEMALLRWMHLRKLVPLAELMEQLGGGAGGRISAPAGSRTAPTTSRVAPATANRVAPTTDARPAPTSGRIASSEARVAPTSSQLTPAREAPVAPARNAVPPATDASPASTGAAGLSGAALKDATLKDAALKDALLAEIRNGKKILYELSIAAAHRIDVSDEAVTFTFGANQNAARGNLEQSRPWIEAAAQRLAGRRINIVVVQAQAPPPGTGTPASEPKPPAAPAADKARSGRDLKAEAMSSSAVQAMLDVFPAEIRDVEEM